MLGQTMKFAKKVGKGSKFQYLAYRQWYKSATVPSYETHTTRVSKGRE